MLYDTPTCTCRMGADLNRMSTWGTGHNCKWEWDLEYDSQGLTHGAQGAAANEDKRWGVSVKAEHTGHSCKVKWELECVRQGKSY